MKKLIVIIALLLSSVVFGQRYQSHYLQFVQDPNKQEVLTTIECNYGYGKFSSVVTCSENFTSYIIIRKRISTGKSPDGKLILETFEGYELKKSKQVFFTRCSDTTGKVLSFGVGTQSKLIVFFVFYPEISIL